MWGGFQEDVSQLLNEIKFEVVSIIFSIAFFECEKDD